MNDFYADLGRAYEESDNLQFFIVENTAKRREFYLAQNAKLARVLASTNGLVEDRNNATVFVPNEKFWDNAPGFQGAVKRAIAEGKPGKVEKRGEFAVMKDRVFAPIGEAG